MKANPNKQVRGLIQAGTRMSNLLYNFAQDRSTKFTDEERSGMAELVRHWDAAERSVQP